MPWVVVTPGGEQDALLLEADLIKKRETLKSAPKCASQDAVADFVFPMRFCRDLLR